MGDVGHSRSEGRRETFSDLGVLWTEDNPYGLRCYEYGLPLNDEPIIRTFRVRASPGASPPNTNSEVSKCINIHSSHILFFDRHDACLAKSTAKYVAISYVWDRDVSDT